MILNWFIPAVLLITVALLLLYHVNYVRSQTPFFRNHPCWPSTPLYFCCSSDSLRGQNPNYPLPSFWSTFANEQYWLQCTFVKCIQVLNRPYLYRILTPMKSSEGGGKLHLKPCSLDCTQKSWCSLGSFTASWLQEKNFLVITHSLFCHYSVPAFKHLWCFLHDKNWISSLLLLGRLTEREMLCYFICLLW